MLDDIFLWPDGTWCFRDDYEDYTWLSEDYEVIPFETSEWDHFYSSAYLGS